MEWRRKGGGSKQGRKVFHHSFFFSSPVIVSLLVCCCCSRSISTSSLSLSVGSKRGPFVLKERGKRKNKPKKGPGLSLRH